jgi:hypothetical protein
MLLCLDLDEPDGVGTKFNNLITGTESWTVVYTYGIVLYYSQECSSIGQAYTTILLTNRS